MRFLKDSDSKDKVIHSLTLLEVHARMCSKSGRTDFNKDCEDLVCELLNLIFDLGLVNKNRISTNYPSIDLGDDHRRICYQISSTNDRKKIQSTIQKFCNHRLHTQYDTLRFLLLVRKKKYRTTFNIPCAVQFNMVSDILDLEDLVQQILRLDSCRIDEISSFLNSRIVFF